MINYILLISIFQLPGTKIVLKELVGNKLKIRILFIDKEDLK